jgi:hypothetical protein
MKRIKIAEIALVIVALANVAVLVAPWPVSPRLTEIATMIVYFGFILLTYREDPASFHRQVSRSVALRILLAPVVFVVVVIVLGRNHLL